MADSAVPITAGVGTNIDTRTESTNNQHRQVIVIGDPATNAGVAPVDVTNGLSVNVTNASLTVGSHAVTNAGTFSVQVSSAPSTAVTNAGTFAVQSATTLNAETTKVIGVTRTADGSGNLLTSTTNALDVNIKSGVNANGQTTMANSAPVVLASNQASIPVASTLTAETTKVIGTVNVAAAQTIATTNAGTFAVQAAATLAAETTKVIGTVNISTAQPITPVDQYGQYETVAASQSAQVLGATGATGDYLAYVTVFPGTAGCGVVTILDNAGTWGTFAGGGTTALPSLVPFRIDVGAFSTSGAWKITTGANVTCAGVGKFT